MIPLAVLLLRNDLAAALIVLAVSSIVALSAYGMAAWALVRLVMT